MRVKWLMGLRHFLRLTCVDILEATTRASAECTVHSGLSQRRTSHRAVRLLVSHSQANTLWGVLRLLCLTFSTDEGLANLWLPGCNCNASRASRA